MIWDLILVIIFVKHNFRVNCRKAQRWCEPQFLFLYLSLIKDLFPLFSMCSPLNTIFIQSPECPCGKSVKWWCGWWWLRIKRPREWTRKEWIKLHSSASKLHIVWVSFGPGGIRIIHIGQSPVECIVIIIVGAVSFFVVCPERRREVAGDGYSINIKSPQSSFRWWCCWSVPLPVCVHVWK